MNSITRSVYLKSNRQERTAVGGLASGKAHLSNVIVTSGQEKYTPTVTSCQSISSYNPVNMPSKRLSLSPSLSLSPLPFPPLSPPSLSSPSLSLSPSNLYSLGSHGIPCVHRQTEATAVGQLQTYPIKKLAERSGIFVAILMTITSLIQFSALPSLNRARLNYREQITSSMRC